MIIIASARGKKKERKRKRLPIVQVSTPSVTLFLVHGISRPNEKDARPWEIAASGSSSFFSFFLLSSPGWKIPGESADFSRQFFTRGQLTGNREISTDVRLSLSLSLSFLAPLEFWKEKKGNDDERGEAKSVTRCYVFTSERSRELAIDRIGPSSVHCSSTSPSPSARWPHALLNGASSPASSTCVRHLNTPPRFSPIMCKLYYFYPKYISPLAPRRRRSTGQTAHVHPRVTPRPSCVCRKLRGKKKNKEE